MGDRCTGHCCQKFTLPYPPEVLWEMYDKWVTEGGPPPKNGIHLIAPMLKYLGLGKHEGLCTPLDDQADRHWYTCKHYDAEKGNCGIYERRPSMCKDYPYASTCNYKACTWDDGVEGAYPPHEYADKMLRHMDESDPRYRVFRRYCLDDGLSTVTEQQKSPEPIRFPERPLGNDELAWNADEGPHL